MDSEKKKSKDLNFREEMTDVKPLRGAGRIDPIPAMTPAVTRHRNQEDHKERREYPDIQGEPAVLEKGEELLFLCPGQQKRKLQRLRRGYFNVADIIDLHHLGEETAKVVLLEFIEMAVDRQMECIRIIHGKGLRSPNQPRLKMMTNHILRKHPRVIAFVSCRPVEGGTGATNVLLSLSGGSGR